MNTDYSQLLPAVYKEFHEGGRYYKGKGAYFVSWMLENHPAAFYMHVERADSGRQAYIEAIYVVSRSAND